jgi:hypothetical protein
VSAIRQLVEVPFESGKTQMLGTESVPVLVSAGVDPQVPERHFVTVGAGLCRPVIARGLACGVIAANGTLAAAARTDQNGQLAVDLTKGRFSLRFVLEVRDPIDVDILVRLGDDAADEQLEAARESTRLAPSARERLDTRRKVELSPPARFVSPRTMSDQFISMNDRRETEPTVRPDDLQADEMFGLTPDGEWVVARIPADQFQSPFGVLLLECITEDRVMLGRRLLPVSANRDGTFYENRMRADELRPPERPAPIYGLPISKVGELLARMSKEDALSEVARLLCQQYVSLRPELRAQLQNLKAAIEASADSEVG